MATATTDAELSEALYLFDTAGYVILRGVLSPDEVAACNKAVDARADEMLERSGELRLSGSDALAGDGKTGRKDLGGLLGWEGDGGRVFRSLLAHERVAPFLHEVVGAGYRLDHHPFLIAQEQGAEGFFFHGGAVNEAGNWDHALQYHCVNQQIRTSLLAMTVQLAPVGPGDGGFVVVPGSHKANFPCPPSVAAYERHRDYTVQPVMEPGDLLLFTEAATHGTLPWKAEHQRRSAIYRFAPCTYAYGRSYNPRWPDEYYADLTDAERAVLEPPYHPRLDRPQVERDGRTVTVESRSGVKKAFDKEVFKTQYF